MKFYQKEINLERYKRGYHLITHIIINSFPELTKIDTGMLHVFIKHTSAGLTINENADPSVRADFQSYFDKIVPENEPDFIHNDEGADDMPAHIKSSLIGSQVSIPITKGRLNLGTWQGIYLCEFRNYGGNRRLVLTAYGQ
ncbi:MAG TPA: secondary thiamine-phosphate synthase enzyme YjbQ [Cyclobacteriaceae bacterium]|nr:secondary thiamine-phosphate synthase enzyme YjbQ [Cyclobacteriaceae bacterium]